MMEHVPQRCEIYELPTGPMPENGSSPVPKSDDTAGHVDAEILSINPFHSDTRPGMISFALWYVLVMKWHVIPLHTVDDEGRCTCGNDECTSAGKHPRIARWQKKASDDPARIREWWERWPDANIGILTGKPTGLLVVDVDPRNDGDISFDQLESEGKKIPGTVECHTGGGGRHYYLRRPEGNARFPQKLAEGIDLKCDDGYVVAPPSRHRSGEEYVWEVSSIPGEETIADTPGWTIDHRETNDRPQKESGEELSVIPEGRRNLTLTSMAGVLRRQGLSKEAIIEELLEINGRRCRPPLSDAEVRTIAGSIVKHSPSPDERVVPDVVLPPEAESQGHDEPVQGRAAVYKAADLATMEFEEVRMLVPEFLPEGVSLLAAAPKTGKSWFVLDLAYSVASGASFLDYPAVDPGPVVYFALEDTQRRMQDRFTKLLGTGFQIPLNLEVVHNWPRLDKGGNDELRLLVEDISPRLIIVDTYVKLKRPQRVGRSIYEEDYGNIRPYVELYRQFGCSVLLVHHTRKSEAEDPLDLISGSNGLNGAVDGMIVMKRKKGVSEGTMLVVHRDLEEELDLAVKFDRETCRWGIRGDADLFRHTGHKQVVTEYLIRNGGSVSPRQVEAITGTSYGTARKLLSEMSAAGLLTREDRGRYMLALPENSISRQDGREAF